MSARVLYEGKKCANTKRIAVVNVWQCVWLRSTVDVCVLCALSQLLFLRLLPVHEEDNFTAITKTESTHAKYLSHVAPKEKKTDIDLIYKNFEFLSKHPHCKLEIWKSLSGAREHWNKEVTKKRNANNQNLFDLLKCILNCLKKLKVYLKYYFLKKNLNVTFQNMNMNKKN